MRFPCFSRALLLLVLTACATRPGGSRMESIGIGRDRKTFARHPSGHPFAPWGFNYDHDERGRLIEDYWETEWPKIEEDFREMKQLGANVVRVHLQFGRFMTSASQPNTNSLARLARLLRLAERTGLYLDVTGLGCYHKPDVPGWYDAMDEEHRWAAQANFWRAVAHVGRGSPAIFCYDLMNEPVSPHMSGTGKDWLGPPFAGKYFVQWISREGKGRERPEIARAWIRQLAGAIHAEDSTHLVTVGLVPWSLPRPGLDSGFHPAIVAPELDFISVHIYPEKEKVDDAIETLKLFNVGKPVVIEETFPLSCSLIEFEQYQKERSAYDRAKAEYDKTVKEARANNQTPPAPFALKPPVSYVAGEPTFFSPAHPVNHSPNNTGIKELPPAQPAFIWYPYGASTRFPVLNSGGGRTAMAGPVYYFDANNPSKTKLPKEFDHTLFIYEWSRNWIVAVHLDENENIAKNPDGSWRMERFCKNMTFKRPMDMELGPDGCLYVIEYGTAWGNNKDTQIVRLEYTGAQN